MSKALNNKVKLNDQVSVKDLGAVGDGLTDNTVAIQAAINSCGTDATVYFPQPSSSYLVTSSITLKTRVSLRGEAKFGSGILADFDGAIFIGSGQLWRTSLTNLSLKNNNAGASAGCLKATFYQGEVKSCQFEAQDGFGIYLTGTAVCVENRISENYFYYCKQAIYSPNDTNKNTDAYVVDNLFYGTGSVQSHIYWYNASGGLFRGNHFYGACGRYFMEMVLGENITISENYFESINNPRIYIQHGNPGAYVISGNKFWYGDGSLTDFNGNKSSLIELNLTAFVSNRTIITGNLFNGGINSLDIIRTNAAYGTNGFSSTVITLDASNSVRGSYLIGTNTFRVNSGIADLFNTISTASQALGQSGSIDRYTYTGATTDTVTLPNSAANSSLDNKTLWFYNDTTTTTATISVASTYIGSKRIYPGSAVQLVNKSGTWYATKLSNGPAFKATTAARPASLGVYDAGFMYFDTTLDPDGKPVWWTGTAYVDATGLVV